MERKVVYILLLLITAGCQERNPQTDNKNNINYDSSRDSPDKSIDATATNSVHTNESAISKTQEELTTNNCNNLVLLLVKTSSFNADVQKHQYKARVDELSAGSPIIKITLRNTERQEDVAIGWLKMDIKKRKLFDITVDPDNPSALTFDTALFNRVVNNCKF